MFRAKNELHSEDPIQSRVHAIKKSAATSDSFERQLVMVERHRMRTSKKLPTCRLFFACCCYSVLSSGFVLVEAFAESIAADGPGADRRKIDPAVLRMKSTTTPNERAGDDDDDGDDHQPSSLPARYRQIADAASHRTPNWPASHNFLPLLDCCSSNDDDDAAVVLAVDGGICATKYRAPRFLKHGPFGLVALITPQYNPAAVPLIDECLDCFDAFVHDLRDTVPISTSSTQQELQQQPLHIIPRAAVPHSCIFMVHEHPSLLRQLDASERDAWIPIDDATMQTLIDDDLSPILASLPLDGLQLQLESILLTPDGGMIAGFVDVSQQQQQPSATEEGGSSPSSLFQNLKQQCTAAVQQRVGALTSRPKNLIHVTLGRVLGFGPGAQGLGGNDDEDEQQQQQQQRVVQLVQRYNERVLPQKVGDIRQRHSRGGVWQVQHLSFLRNTVWFCDENIIYKTWDLTTNKE